EAGAELGEERKNDEGLFGTENAKAFEKFLEGYDAVYFLERSQGNVVSQFNPEEPLEALLGALDLDSGWESPYRAAVQLCRLGIQYRIGKAELYERSLKTLIEKVPESAMAYIPLGELYQSANAPGRAAETYEKAHEIEPNEPAILTRLGLAQAAAGMPVNAERNLKKAVEMEGPEKPSMDFLGQVLQQQGRGHEVPGLWKKVVDANPGNANARAKYAVALANAGKADEAQKAFEEGLEATNGAVLVKRFYAPLLRQKKDYDRAMDMYEDVLDEQPTDVPVMLEYAQTLQEGGRQIDVPPVLNDVLKANPDPNTRAQVQAWLIEIEQKNRVEKVKEASEKVQAGDAQAAIDILTPMKNWLADYWKMWVVLAGAYNKEEHPEEAQEAAQKALEIFPACEPAFLELNGALTQQGRHEDAYNLLTQAQQALPQSLNIAINRALAAKRSGRQDEARQMAQQIKRVAGDKNEQLNKVLQELES
ncbi:MAG: tetratricopeptide repeat protein, partial [Fimbriimonadaceae bacterium]